MEAVVNCYPSISIVKLPTRHTKIENASSSSIRIGFGFGLAAMRDLPLIFKRTPSLSHSLIPHTNSIFRLPISFSMSTTVDSQKHMATTSNNQIQESTAQNVSNKEQPEEGKKLTTTPPPPPEKPEPGDCCGSGCVRCVWDVYYEELEEYNKLYNSSSS